LSVDKKYLRPTLLLNLLRNVSENLKHQKSVRFFELGKIFALSGIDKVEEKMSLSGVVAYKQNKGSSEEFYEIKGIVELMLSKLGFSDVSFSDAALENGSLFWHSGRAADIFLDGKKIGVLGEVGYSALEKMHIKNRVAAFEIGIESVFHMINEDIRYSSISKFPASVRDLAVLVGSDVKISDVQGVMEISGANDLIDVDLFDIYEDIEGADGLNKSVAFHLVFQSDKRTLLDKDVDENMKKIETALKSKNWEIRGV
jgi:phenylalanyl-tRNA synthetase beta chain